MKKSTFRTSSWNRII